MTDLLAQNELHIQAIWGDRGINKESNYSNGDERWSFDVLKMYIGGLRLYKHGELVNQGEKEYNLIDFLDSTSSIALMKPLSDFDSIRFLIGTDSLLNYSGAHGGDLDPLHGMYWAWHSGYINFKLEGTRSSPVDTQQIQYHIGGFAAPYETMQSLVFSLEDSRKYAIYLDLLELLSQKNFLFPSRIMRPSAEATEFAELWGKSFYLR